MPFHRIVDSAIELRFHFVVVKIDQALINALLQLLQQARIAGLQGEFQGTHAAQHRDKHVVALIEMGCLRLVSAEILQELDVLAELLAAFPQLQHPRPEPVAVALTLDALLQQQQECARSARQQQQARLHPNVLCLDAAVLGAAAVRLQLLVAYRGRHLYPPTVPPDGLRLHQGIQLGTIPLAIDHLHVLRACRVPGSIRVCRMGRGSRMETAKGIRLADIHVNWTTRGAAASHATVKLVATIEALALLSLVKQILPLPKHIHRILAFVQLAHFDGHLTWFLLWRLVNAG